MWWGTVQWIVPEGKRSRPKWRYLLSFCSLFCLERELGSKNIFWNNGTISASQNDKELANTKDGTAILVEDNIGLRATVEITDENVISKAKKKLLRGWSFGFYCNEQDEEVGEDGITKRSVKDIDLIEVSIIDDKKIPAYIGTSIEMRDDKPRLLEYRSEEFDENSFSYEENNINFADMTMTQKREILSLAFSKTFTNGWLEDFDNNFIYGVVDENYELYKIPYSIIDGNVNFDLSKQVKVIKGGYQEVRTKDRPEQSEKIDKIDYSKYELILKNMKEEKIWISKN